MNIYKILDKTIGKSSTLFKCTYTNIDPLGQPKVTAGRDHCFRTYFQSVCPSVRPHFSNLENKPTENNVRYWRDYGSGRVDHWWHLSCILYVCLPLVQSLPISFLAISMSTFTVHILLIVYRIWWMLLQVCHASLFKKFQTGIVIGRKKHLLSLVKRG